MNESMKTSKKKTIKRNKTMLQAFYWFMPDHTPLWNRLKDIAEDLKKCGINMIWLPPACKASRLNNRAGYNIYDRYDLGEYDQKEGVPTKYGTKEEYIECIKALKKQKIAVIADMVLNQMCGADATEMVEVYDCDNDNRGAIDYEHPHTIEAWTAFNYDKHREEEERRAKEEGREAAPVETWDKRDFNAVDYNAKDPDRKNTVYLFKDKHFADDVNKEKGNFDYLTECNVDYNEGSPAREKTFRWGEWYLDVTNVDGFRLDAVKHISKSYMEEWINYMNQVYAEKYKRKKLFFVGEYLKPEEEIVFDYPDTSEEIELADEDPEKDEVLDENPSICHLFDFPLQDKLKKCDSRLFTNNLLADDSKIAVTFVNNHDMDPYQGYSGVRIDDRLQKEKAYAWILFQSKGLPCVYLGDITGYKYPYPHEFMPGTDIYTSCTAQMNRLETILKMSLIRYECAYGRQQNIDEGDIRGYIRHGLKEPEDSGMVVLMTYGRGGTVHRKVNKCFGKKMVNIFSPNGGKDAVKLDDGYGDFHLEDGQLGVWITEDAYHRFMNGDYRAFKDGYDWAKDSSYLTGIR